MEQNSLTLVLLLQECNALYWSPIILSPWCFRVIKWRGLPTNNRVQFVYYCRVASFLASNSRIYGSDSRFGGWLSHIFRDFYKLQFRGSVHHNDNWKTPAWCSKISIYFTYMCPLHVSGEISPIIRSCRDPLTYLNLYSSVTPDDGWYLARNM